MKMTYGEFLKLFDKKKKEMSIKDISIGWGMHRNTINYLREMAKVKPNGVMNEELSKRIK